MKSQKLLQLRLEINLNCRVWTAHYGPAGAARYLHFATAALPRGIPYSDEAAVRRHALSAATRQMRKRYNDGQIVSISINPEHVAAPIARLELGGSAWAA
jgi:hypothetical protein